MPSEALGNRLLARLPVDERNRVLAKLRPVPLELRKQLYRAGQKIETVYFLNRGIASFMLVMENGAAIEVATIGNEGAVGLGVLFADGISVNDVIIQVPGDGFSIAADVFAEIAREGTTLRRLVTDYNAAFLIQSSYSVACNGLHSILPRCCRWLLMTRDRTDSDELPLTHEFLAIMLGVRRSSVSEALGPLQQLGLIESKRGTIKILDRSGLEKLACECYRRVRKEFERLLGDRDY